MRKKHLFISHVNEERQIASRLKRQIIADFPDGMEVFVSSDSESIAAGEQWLESVESALRACSVFCVLCSPESVNRPWINFEAGAAWMLDIPLIPICHAGLSPRDLAMPLSLRQAVDLTDASGLERPYGKIAAVLGCKPPPAPKRAFPAESRSASAGRSVARDQLEADRDARRRLLLALQHPKFRWRTLSRLAAEAAVTEERAADLLRGDESVRFSRNEAKNAIVGLRSRVG